MKKIALISLLLLGVSFMIVGLSDPSANANSPTPAVIKIREASRAWDENKYAEACHLWREALDLNPKYPAGVWHDIGMCSMEMKAYDDAVIAYSNAIRLYPKETALAYWERGRAYLKAGNVASAEKDFLKSISIDEHYTDSYFQMYLIEENRNNFEKALYYTEKTIENAPTWHSGYTNKAYLLEKSGKAQEAKDLLLKNEMVILNDKRNRSKDYYYNLLGDIYRTLKDYPNAIENYQKALTINPKHPYAEINICATYIDQNMGEEAVRHCLKGINIFPHWNGFFNLCEAFAVAKQYDRGLRVCQYLTDNEVTHYRTYKYCAMNKAGMGKISEALADIEKARVEVNNWEPEEVKVGEARTWLDDKEKTLKELDDLEQDIKSGKYSIE